MIPYVNEGDEARAQLEMKRHHLIMRRNRGENVEIPVRDNYDNPDVETTCRHCNAPVTMTKMSLNLANRQRGGATCKACTAIARRRGIAKVNKCTI